MATESTTIQEGINLTISLIPLVAAALIAPGYIITFVSSRFVTARPNFAASLALSSVYYALAWLVASLIMRDFCPASTIVDGLKDINSLHAFLIILVGPVIVGSLAGRSMQRETIYNILRWKKWPKCLQFYPASGIPSAWDWKFLRDVGGIITVHLKDNSEITASYDHNCFVSTDPNERDIYLHKIQGWKKDCKDLDVEDIEGLLLTGDSIHKIVFHAPERSRAAHEQKKNSTATENDNTA